MDLQMVHVVRQNKRNDFILQQIGTLEEIVMPQNGIRAEGILELAKAVEASPYLKHLNLNDNTFGRKGALAMAKVCRGREALPFGRLI